MDIAERLKFLIAYQIPEYRRWKSLEEISGIASSAWQHFFRGNQRPTAAMVEAICQTWPEFAFWISTGRTDKENKHIAPEGVQASNVTMQTSMESCRTSGFREIEK